MEQDHQRSLEQHDQDLRSLQRKTESNIEFLKQEHSMAQGKVSLTFSQASLFTSVCFVFVRFGSGSMQGAGEELPRFTIYITLQPRYVLRYWQLKY